MYKEIENEKHFTSLQNSQVFIYPIVYFGFFFYGIVCLNSVRKKIFMAIEKREDSWCLTILMAKTPLDSLAVYLT